MLYGVHLGTRSLEKARRGVGSEQQSCGRGVEFILVPQGLGWQADSELEVQQ